MTEWRDHEARAALLGELHARPRPAVTAPGAAARIDLQTTPGEAARHVGRLRDRLEARGEPVPEAGSRHHVYTEGDLKVVFERHTEFVSYTLFDTAPGAPFETDILTKAPADAFDSLPGARVSAIRIHIEKSADGVLDETLAERVFGRPEYAASHVRGGDAALASDFQPDADGFIRFLVFDSTPSDVVRGRMVQRIFELEAYRMAAMLALPVAREAGPLLEKLEAEMDTMSDRIAAGPHAAKDRDILQRLTRLAGEAERLRARGDFRFGAARAYGDIVQDRNLRLREARIEGHERVGVFIERRLAPALKTCEAIATRQQALAERVDRGVQLLATRVQVDVEEQNAELLDAMNRRAAAQLKLQETVEALSTVAITYYAVGLILYVAQGLQEGGWGVNPYLVAGVATPVVFFTVLAGVRLVRVWLKRQGEVDEE
ncbi:MAG: DUF3422 family protein [Oceanicaulis sp.]